MVPVPASESWSLETERRVLAVAQLVHTIEYEALHVHVVGWSPALGVFSFADGEGLQSTVPRAETRLPTFNTGQVPLLPEDQRKTSSSPKLQWDPRTRPGRSSVQTLVLRGASPLLGDGEVGIPLSQRRRRCPGQKRGEVPFVI